MKTGNGLSSLALTPTFPSPPSSLLQVTLSRASGGLNAADCGRLAISVTQILPLPTGQQVSNMWIG